ncbi:hypothetical protein STEG23_030168, partial [Scotinomys teguina]
MVRMSDFLISQRRSYVKRIFWFRPREAFELATLLLRKDVKQRNVTLLERGSVKQRTVWVEAPGGLFDTMKRRTLSPGSWKPEGGGTLRSYRTVGEIPLERNLISEFSENHCYHPDGLQTLKPVLPDICHSAEEIQCYLLENLWTFGTEGRRQLFITTEDACNKPVEKKNHYFGMIGNFNPLSVSPNPSIL